MTNKYTSVHPQVAIQSLLRPALIPVSANKDFEEFKQIIEETDAALIAAGLEDLAVTMALENLQRIAPHADSNAKVRHARKGIKALRTNVLKTMLRGISDRSEEHTSEL